MLTSDPLFWLLAITAVMFTGMSKSGLAGDAGVVLFPFALLGVSIGCRIQQLISQQNFMIMYRAMLLISGVSLLVK